ncbi:CFEM domain-containing protein [Colletotrichum truncatum]|uniref:CFEM domain-containing protein n=1 Tax=Colletotrichum truncatum TaxID=5467 RepID=A0ACC3YKX8_COLTU|nr:CFEM domain-containing protein [Colletotrichum truncatum]KAF6782863.1 CFEM domain-containing protein [Colletotrichum truncatum]
MACKSLFAWVLLMLGVVLAQNASDPVATPQPTNETSSAFPSCALQCIFTEVVKSPCQTVENTTCVCTDQEFYKQAETCIMSGCTPPEGIATQKAKADYCHDPVRSQVTMLYGLRSLEVAAWLLVIFRFYARWASRLPFGRDDYVMMAVALIYIPQLVISQLMDDNAFGRDIWNVEWDKIILSLKLFFIQEPLYLLQLGLTKISILFLYLRIFPGRRFKLITYTFMAFVAGATCILVGGSIVECLPVGYFWEAWHTEYLIHTKKCLNLTVAVFSAAGLSIFQDIIMIILPIPPLLKTQLPTKDKIGVGIMFVLGLLITGASCLRLRFVNVAYSPNPFWDFEPALLWSLVELAMSFLVTSLPAMHNYHTRILKPKLRAFIDARREKSTPSQDTRSAPTGQSFGHPHLRTWLARRAQRRDENRFISTLAFTRVSWNSITDRNPSQSEEKLPSFAKTGGIAAKAPQITLEEIGVTPGSDDSLDEYQDRGARQENADSIIEERETVHALAWVGRPRAMETDASRRGGFTQRNSSPDATGVSGDSIV